MGERKHRTSNIEHRTLNSLREAPNHSMFGVRCSMFDVPQFKEATR
jgi:hypothetical protein